MRTLPIGLDRNCWKLSENLPLPGRYFQVSLPIGLDRNCWKHEATSLSRDEAFFSTLPIGLDRNCWKLLLVAATVDTRKFSLPIGLDRNCWKLDSKTLGIRQEKIFPTDRVRSELLETLKASGKPSGIIVEYPTDRVRSELLETSTLLETMCDWHFG